jgi:hypothetical protein
VQTANRCARNVRKFFPEKFGFWQAVRFLFAADLDVRIVDGFRLPRTRGACVFDLSTSECSCSEVYSNRRNVPSTTTDFRLGPRVQKDSARDGGRQKTDRP